MKQWWDKLDSYSSTKKEVKGSREPNMGFVFIIALIPIYLGLITFGLACILCFAICFGLILATIAGIAYGYNYSMAEFITFTRSDVTIFMRRGQFYDKPDLMTRRSGDSEDMFNTNNSTDYEDQKPPAESKPLADTWLKTQDTRKYAEILTRYNPPKENVDPPIRRSEVVALPSGDRASPLQVNSALTTKAPDYRLLPNPKRFEHIISDQVPAREFHLKPTPNPPIISIVPNPLMPTVSWRSGSSKIMMRNFKPMEEHTVVNKFIGRPETLFPIRSTGPQSISILNPKEQAKENLRDNSNNDNYVPMRVWGTTSGALIPEDPDDVDEDNIVYKPV